MMSRSVSLSPQSPLVVLVGLAAIGGAIAALELSTGSGSGRVATHEARHAAGASAAVLAAPRVSSPAPAAALPSVVARALGGHQVVVVSLVTPGSQVDVIAAQEASQGAARAGVGWVSLDVLDDSQAEPLMHRFGVVQAPGVLVFRRPGDLVSRIEGFADRDVVAQVATEAVG